MTTETTQAINRLRDAAQGPHLWGSVKVRQADLTVLLTMLADLWELTTLGPTGDPRGDEHICPQDVLAILDGGLT